MCRTSGQLIGHHFPNCRLRPCLDTLVPWPWVGSQSRRTGNILCDVIPLDGVPAFPSPRQLLKGQLETLRERHGLVLKTAFEYEFVVLDSDTHKPIVECHTSHLNLGTWDRCEALFAELHEILEAMGVEVSTWTSEETHGQFEVNTEPAQGVRGADVAFYVKNAVKGFFQTRGYTATFLKSVLPGLVSTLQTNHSLWKAGQMTVPGCLCGPPCDTSGVMHKDKDVVGEGESVMSDSADPNNMSVTAKHWLAGLIHHARALSAFLNPFDNGYHVHNSSISAPKYVSWGVDDRTKMIRVKNSGQNNTFLEHRAVAGTANPYLVLAAVVAAGMDGLERKLQCPPPSQKGRNDECQALPRTLSEALDALEEDQRLQELLGEPFVQCYVALKRECDVKPFEDAALKTMEEMIELEKKMYMDYL